MWEVFFYGFFAVAALSVIFVSAGRYGGASGGEQTKAILGGAGNALASVAGSLEQTH